MHGKVNIESVGPLTANFISGGGIGSLTFIDNEMDISDSFSQVENQHHREGSQIEKNQSEVEPQSSDKNNYCGLRKGFFLSKLD